MGVNSMVKRPHGLKIVLHSRFQVFWNGMQNGKVLQVLPFGLVKRLSSTIKPGNQGRHVTKNSRMHQSWNVRSVRKIILTPKYSRVVIESSCYWWYWSSNFLLLPLSWFLSTILYWLEYSLKQCSHERISTSFEVGLLLLTDKVKEGWLLD